jgi:hypothetical protein
LATKLGIVEGSTLALLDAPAALALELPPSVGVRRQARGRADAVRGLALPRGLVDNKVCALDGVWTALRLVWRRGLRDGARPD